LVGKPEGMRLLGIPRCRWRDNIKMDLKELRQVGTNWFQLVYDRNTKRALVNTEMNFEVP
jgi:hypothetical protein